MIKNKMHLKIFGVLLSILLLLGMQFSIVAAAQTDKEIIFQEQFNKDVSLTQQGWSSDDFDIEKNEIIIPHNKRIYLNKKSEHLELKDYIAEATAMFDNVSGDSGQSLRVVSLVARATSASNGYEFGLCLSSTGQQYVRLYDRAKKQNIIKNTEIERNMPYRLKMELKGDNVKCYLNNELLIEVNWDSNKSGAVGLRTSGYTGIYSNVSIWIPKQGSQSSSSQVTTTTQEQVTKPTISVIADLTTSSLLTDKTHAPTSSTNTTTTSESSIIELVDAETNIILRAKCKTIPRDSELVVLSYPEGLEMENAEKAIGKEARKIYLNEIGLLIEDEETTPVGSVKLSIPIPKDYKNNYCKVYKIGPSGTQKDMKATLNKDRLEFESRTLGQFALVETTSVVHDGANTGVGSLIFIMVIVAGMALGLMMLMLNHSKNKKDMNNG